MAVVATLRAHDSSELLALDPWLHRAPCDVRALTFDEETQTVTLPFSQETAVAPELALPQRELMRSGILYREYRQPYVRCALRVRMAGALRTERIRFDPTAWIYGLRYDEAAGVVYLDLGLGDEPEVAIGVGGLDVEIDITDEVAMTRSRRVGRLLPWDS